MMEKETDIRFADLFAGIGGIRLGMESAGFRCVWSCEKDRACREVYRDNFGDEPAGDITEIEASSLPDFELLCGGFPCQPFSISGLKRGFADTRGTLFFEIERILREKRPPAFLLENVRHLIHHDHGRTLDAILGRLRNLGYQVSWEVLTASDFGLPQSRERVIIAGSLSRPFDFSWLRREPAPALSAFLDSEGDFEYLDPPDYTLIEAPKRQKSGLIFAGYRNRPLRKRGVREGTESLSRTHRQPDRIYSAAGVHPTLSSQETSGRYFILTDDGKVRKMTLPECWRIMGFPEDFRKAASPCAQYRQLGNSVAVPLFSALAEEIRAQFF